MIYFIYESTSLKPHQRFVEEIGQYDGFLVGTMPESLLERETIPECMVIPKDVALAYKFADRRSGSLNIRPGTTQYDQTDPDRLEPYKDKFKYYLTDEDKHNAHLFQKAIMHCILNKYYNNLLYMVMGTPDIFKEEVGCLSFEDLFAKKKAMQDRIDACKDMEETSELMHYHFGVQKYPDIETKIDL